MKNFNTPPNNTEPHLIPENLQKELETLGIQSEEQKQIFWKQILNPYIDYINTIVDNPQKTQEKFSITKLALKNDIQILQILLNSDLTQPTKLLETLSKKEANAIQLNYAFLHQYIKDFFSITDENPTQQQEKHKILELFINDLLAIIASETLYDQITEIIEKTKRNLEISKEERNKRETTLDKIQTNIPEEPIDPDSNPQKIITTLENINPESYPKLTIFPIEGDKAKALITIIKELLPKLTRTEKST